MKIPINVFHKKKKLVIFETLPEIDKLDTRSTTKKEYF